MTEPEQETEWPGVSRQAGVIPEDVRKATAALGDELAIALLITIQQSGETRFNWLRQELGVPNQDIVVTLGRLYDADLIEMSTVGKAEARTTAYFITPFGATMLEALMGVRETMASRRRHVPVSETKTETHSEPEADDEEDMPLTFQKSL